VLDYYPSAYFSLQIDDFLKTLLERKNAACITDAADILTKMNFKIF
jgi:hypothetical protein